MSFEYDPHNKLRHTSYWFESDPKKEWPLSENAKEEDPPRDDEAFDYMAKASKFYMEVETDGSMAPKDVVLKVRPSLRPSLRILLKRPAEKNEGETSKAANGRGIKEQQHRVARRARGTAAAKKSPTADYKAGVGVVSMT